jgi:site-specific DNA recombinase
VVMKLDRAFRSTKDALITAEQFNKLGRDFVSINERIDTSSATGKLFFTMMAALAAFERDLTSERTAAVLADKQLRGEKLGGFTPYGYVVQEAPRPGRTPLKVLKPEASEQQVIARIHALKSRGCSLRSIAQDLNQAGYPTRTGTGWSHKTVAKIVKRLAA